jgi:hypothetical protein
LKELAQKDSIILSLMQMMIPQTSEMPDGDKIQNLFEVFKTLHQKEA